MKRHLWVPLLLLASYASAQRTVVLRSQHELSACATEGNGSAASPWTGWDSACAWGQPGVWHAAAGHYSAPASPSEWAVNGFALVGDGSLVTEFSFAAPDGLSILAPAYDKGVRVRVEGLAVVGGPGTANAFHFRDIHGSTFRDLKATGTISGSAFLFEGLVGGRADSLYVLRWGDGPETRFGVGIELAESGPWHPVTTFRITNAEVRMATRVGILLSGASFCSVQGYSEFGARNWEVSAVHSWGNTLDAADSESATGPEGILLAGYGNTVMGGASTDLIRVTGFSNVIHGGVHSKVRIEPGAMQNALRDFSFDLDGVSSVDDFGVGTVISNLHDQAKGVPR